MFAIVHTVGDEHRILKSFETKEAAFAYGEKIAGDYRGKPGILTLDEIPSQDRAGNITCWKLYHGWR